MTSHRFAPYVCSLTLVLLMVVVGLETSAPEHSRGSSASELTRPVVSAGADRFPDAFSFRWELGKSYRYGLSLSSQHLSVVAVPGNQGEAQRFEAQVALQGEMVITPLEQPGAVQRIAMRLEHLDHVALNAFGKSAFEDLMAARSVLVGPLAYLEVSAQGEVQSLGFGEGVPEVFKTLVQMLVLEGEVRVAGYQRGPSSWSTPERSSTGQGLTRFETVQAGSESFTLSRSRARYTSLRSLDARENRAVLRQTLHYTGSVALNRRGYVDGIDTVESLEVTGADGDVRLRSQLRFNQRLLDVIDVTEVSGATVSPEMNHGFPKVSQHQADAFFGTAESPEARLTKLAKGMTSAEVLRDIKLISAGATLPDFNGWLVRATALLALSPQACEAVATLANVPGCDTRTRSLVLDLLASANSPAAQTALRGVLTGPALQESTERDYTMMFQRLSLIHDPTPETVAFAQAQFDAPASTALGFASAYTLGAVAGQLKGMGEEGAAMTLVGQLSEALGESDDPAYQSALVRGLGNAGFSDSVDVLAPLIEADSAQVRRSLAVALRKMPTQSAQDLLLSLAADPNTSVQISALRTLEGMAPSPDTLGAIASFALSGAAATENLGTLVTLVEGHVLDPALKTKVALALLPQCEGDHALEAAVRRLL